MCDLKQNINAKHCPCLDRKIMLILNLHLAEQ